jgi:hypothetical protein
MNSPAETKEDEKLPSYLSKEWMDLRWSSWMPLMAAHPLALAQLPSLYGFYRVRRLDVPTELLHIGWTSRGVREVVERLSRQVHMPVQPYDDPNVPASLLWHLRQEGIGFDVSGAHVPLDDHQEAIRLVEKLRVEYALESRRWHAQMENL